MLTRDPAVLDYAATLGQFQSVPLAWQRTHVVLTPGGRARHRRFPRRQDRRSLTMRFEEARGAMGPFWWQVLSDCELASPAA